MCWTIKKIYHTIIQYYLVAVLAASYVFCQEDHSCGGKCGKNECCIVELQRNGRDNSGCRPKAKIGEDCDFLPGFTCPCRDELECHEGICVAPMKHHIPFENEEIAAEFDTRFTTEIAESTSESIKTTTEFITDEMKEPTTETVGSVTEMIEPTTEFVRPTTETVGSVTEMIEPTTEFVRPTTEIDESTSGIIEHTTETETVKTIPETSEPKTAVEFNPSEMTSYFSHGDASLFMKSKLFLATHGFNSISINANITLNQ
nr:venom protein [Lampona murina]